MNKPVVLSGAQPSGEFTLGNYLGALKQFPQYQEKYTAIFLLVDLHALTTRPDPSAFHQACLNSLATYLACGLDPNQSLLVLQSAVPEHTELNWLLQPFVYFGELQRMTQFKDKSKQHANNVNAGLFNYPTLMAADILLYDTAFVPVGEDQIQHIELTRDIAERVNHHFESSIFKVPERLGQTTGSRVMSLSDPHKKMSKSINDPTGTILLNDSADSILQKCLGAMTDSDSPPEIRHDKESKPGISNLIEIYATLTEQTIESVCALFSGKGYVHLKKAVAEVLIDILTPVQTSFKHFRSDEENLKNILKESTLKARARAQLQLDRYKELMGLIRV